MKNISAISGLALLAMCSTAALAQVTVHESTTTDMNGNVTTRKVVTDSQPVIAVPAPATTTTTTVITTDDSAAVPVIVPAPGVMQTETHWHTDTHTVAAPGTMTYALVDFDLNHDMIVSTPEVGEKLFKMYDTDGNQIIDNNEFERRAVLTVVPVERNTTISYDFDGDGIADKVATTSQVFVERTGLAAFDRNGDGLSPHEFTGRSFLVADINNDKAVDLSEWRGSYIASIDKKNKEDAQVNH